MCYITIHIDYNKINDYIIIDFGQYTNNTYNYLSIETLFTLVKEYNVTISNIEYMCLSYDFCDKNFINKWIYYLVNINYEILQDKLSYILISKNPSNKCYIGEKFLECLNGMCIASFNTNFGPVGFGTDCEYNMSLKNATLHVKIQSIDFQPMHYSILEYICTSFECNGNLSFNNIWNKTKMFFNFSKRITDWLFIRNNMKQILDHSFNKMKKKKKILSNDNSTSLNQYSTPSNDYFSSV
ncbi:unnamed protein product, partial [Rotaria sp. Silwood2]